MNSDEHTPIMTEAEYHDLVASWLSESFADVEHEARLESGRRVDFVAHTPFQSYAIEVEDGHSNKELYNGIGQAIIYARETGFEPVLVLPAPGWDGPTRYGDVEIETV